MSVIDCSQRCVWLGDLGVEFWRFPESRDLALADPIALVLPEFPLDIRILAKTGSLHNPGSW